MKVLRTPSLLRKRRAYLLTWVLAIIVLMLALIAALHHYEVVSRRISDQGLSELQFLQARRWELATLNNLTPGLSPPKLDLSGSTRSVANGTYVPDNIGAEIFHQAEWYAYDGFPDLEVKRDAPSQTPPPFYQRYSSRVNSWSTSLPKKEVQTLATRLTPLAAYAPRGSIHLDSVGSWSSPPLDAKKPYEKSTGEEPWVVAGSDIRLGSMPYGRVHTGRTGKIKVGGGGLAMPVGGDFPQAGLEAALCDAISGNLMNSLREGSEALDDKTNLVGGEPPWVWDANGEKFLGMFSVRSSMQFKCYSIPIMDQVNALWHLHIWAPFGPDLGTALTKDRLAFLNKAVKEASGRARDLFDKKLGYTIRLRVLKGGQGIPADRLFYQTEQPAVPGLLKSYLSLRRALEVDDARLTAQEAAGATALQTDLESSQSLLLWLGQVGPTGFSNADTPKPSVPFTKDAHAQIPDGIRLTGVYTKAWVGPIVLNRLYDRLSMSEKGAFTLSDSDKAVALVEHGKISPDLWELVLFGKNTPLDPAKVADGPLTPLQFQHEFIRFLLDTGNSNNPWNKTGEIVKVMDIASLGLDANLKSANEVIEEWKSQINKEVKKTRPEDIEADNQLSVLNATFREKKGLQGSAYVPYGLDVFFLVETIRSALNGNWPDTWLPTNPLVYVGGGKTSTAALEFTPKGAVFSANFTVPAGRTFYYADSVTIKGDLCLDRGSCMVVRGKLNLVNPEPSNIFNIPWFGNSGRIVMEPGSTLVVDGDLSTEGTRYTGSVLLLTEGGRVDPMTCAILCGGSVNLPWGMSNGMNIPQLFGTLGDSKNIHVAAFSYLFTELVPMGAKFPLGNPLAGWAYPGPGVFSPRRPYFAQFCPEWEFRPLIIPLPFPPFSFTIYLPWDVEPKRENPWNIVWQYLAPFYAAYDNLVMGENLSKHSRFYLNGAAPLVLVVPKISPAQLLPDGWRLPPPPAFEKPDTEELSRATLTAFLEQAESTRLGLADIQAGKTPGRPTLSKIPVPTDFNQWVNFMLKIYLKVMDWTHVVNPAVLTDGMACETSGCLVYGKSISVGLDERSDPMIGQAFLASGLFVAEKDINIHALHTIGCLISRTGSINSMSGVHTELLANPQFTRAYLNRPYPSVWGPKGGLQVTPEKVGNTVMRLFDFRYGRNLPKPVPLFVGVPGPWRLTQEGYSQ